MHSEKIAVKMGLWGGGEKDALSVQRSGGPIPNTRDSAEKQSRGGG